MSSPEFVEIAVWSDSDCTRQIVEFELPVSVCNRLDGFLSSVNDFLVDKEYIKGNHSNFLTNLELSPVIAITASQEIVCDYYKVDPETKKLEKVISRPKSMLISSRKL